MRTIKHWSKVAHVVDATSMEKNHGQIGWDYGQPD